MLSMVDENGVLLSNLWIDRPDALQNLRGRAGEALLTDQQIKAAADVITKGYGVMQLDLRPGVYEELDRQLDEIWEKRPTDVAYGGSVGDIVGDFAISDLPTHYTRHDPPLYRLCCAHTHSPAMEEIYFNKDLHREVSFLFGEPAIAVQTLYFEYGSRQGQHRDTSVVSFNPLSHLLAAWVALEDIEEGTGELEYFPGSHRIENFRYGDGSIIWRPEYGPESMVQMNAGIREAAERNNLKAERFLAKRGEALIWHHSLAHGGGPVTKPGRTRKSLVIHFTTLSNYERQYHQLIYKHPELDEYWTFQKSTAEIIERDGCYVGGSVIADWKEKPLPPTKPAGSYSDASLKSSIAKILSACRCPLIA